MAKIHGYDQITLLLRGMLNLNSVEQTAVVVDEENLKKLAVHSRNHSK